MIQPGTLMRRKALLIGMAMALLMGVASTAVWGGERWLGAAIGADFSNYDPMGTVSVEMGLWPNNKGVGYQAYLEFADPGCGEEMWTIAGEPVFRFWRLYTGIGLSMSDERLCDGRAGTKWNFSVVLGMRVSKRLDVQWRHRSHGDDLGIREDTPNEGVNLIQLRWRFRNR